VFAREPHERFKSTLELSQTFIQAVEAGGSGSASTGDVGAWSEPAPDDDDDEEEEKTVKWDLPADWSLSGSSPSAAPLPALPRLPSAPLPLAGSALALAAAPSSVTLPPVTRPGAFFTGDLARVARLPPEPGAFTLPALPAVSAPYPMSVTPGQRRLGMLSRGLIFGAALGAVSALSLWIVQSVSSTGDETTASTELALEPTLDGEGNAIASKPSARRIPDPKELPRIIQTDDLPRVPEDADEEIEGTSQTITVSSVKSEAPTAFVAPRPGRPPAAQLPAALPRSSPPRVAALPPARPAAARTPARPAAPKRSKPAPSCNPPYFFDSNNIRRLKLECL
jgi:hypothetical protein